MTSRKRSTSMSSRRRQIQNPPDWHKADVVAALHKRGLSLRKLSAANGYSQATTLSNALHRHWPKAEQIIADAIGVPPWDIWPSRYPERLGHRDAA